LKKDNKRYQRYAWFSEEEIESYLDPTFDWTTIPTRHLLDMLRSEQGREHTGLHKKFKEVLVDREHIPTKAEAKEIRKKKLKEKQNR
jgi:hypothetical protein